MTIALSSRRLILALLALMWVHDAAAECRNALASDAKSYESWRLSVKDVETLRNVYYRIANTSRRYPQLQLCKIDEPNAVYVASAHTIFIMAGLIRLYAGD